MLVGLSVIEDIGAAVGSELSPNIVGSEVDIEDVGAVVLTPLPVKLRVGTGDSVLSPLTLSEGAKLDTSEELTSVGASELVIFVELGVGTGDDVVLDPDAVPPSVGDKDTLDDPPLDPAIVGDELPSKEVVGASVPDESYV